MNPISKAKKIIQRVKLDQRTCSICNTSFLSRKQKTIHLRLHRPARPEKKIIQLQA